MSKLEIIDTTKISIAAVIGAVFAKLEPIHNAMFVLIFIFIADIFIGMLAGMICRSERFRFPKFAMAVIYLVMYLLIVTCIFVIGHKMDDAAQALFVIKTITYVFTYFYVANILKNLRALFPDNQPIAFLEYIVHLEILKKVPALENFLNKHKENTRKKQTGNELNINNKENE